MPGPSGTSEVTVRLTGYGKHGDLRAPFWTAERFTFRLGRGQVIRALDEAVAGMRRGERAVVDASPSSAYGAEGFEDWGIAPHATLRFEIELLAH